MTTSLKGHLLIAAPSLVAPLFARSVILMCEHSPEGAMGLILNRPTEATVGDVAEQVLNEPLDWNKPILLGGPVQGPLMVVHDAAAQADHIVLEGVYTSFDAEKVRRLLTEQAEPSLVIANYSGWGPGQLEGEMREGSWLTLPAEPELVFWDQESDLWSHVVRRARSAELARLIGLASLPEDPSLN
ncbi:MAG: UPF0301 protein [Isosphaeraceae bacterium]|jgi:putative transcriptional regulator|nr:MAG: UPF0301 protein [Isosphaeraceae bacterium]